LRSGEDRDRESGVRRRATAIGSGTREGLSGAELLPGARVLLVAGIANPQRFAEDVRAAGWDVAGEMWFADHHAFTAADVARIAVKARESRAAAVFTTDKDAVRFETLGPVPFPLFAVPLTVEFDPPTILFERVSSVLSARSAHPGPEFSGAEAYRRPADGNRSPAGGLR